MSREAMKQALEVLEYIYEGANNQGPHTGISWRDVSNKAEPIITALRQALANEALDRMAENERELGIQMQPDEPVACHHKRYTVDVNEQTGTCHDCGAEGRMQFVVNEAQPQPADWVGLTMEDKQEYVAQDYGGNRLDAMDWAEKRLKEKNR